MTRLTASVTLVLGLLAFSSPAATAQDSQPLPSTLGLADVVRIAGERRDEIQAARARTAAGQARPTIVSALSDPMVSPSLDHLPFLMNGADYSITLEQQTPLSGIRGHRRASALADVDRLRADTTRRTFDVGIEAGNAYLMLQERRRTTTLVNEQIAFARDVVSAANARYASGTAPQSDVLRAEVEVARLEAIARALVSEVRAAEAMLNTSLALDADKPVPPLAMLSLPQTVAPWAAIKTALSSRPELAAGRAEIARADAHVRDGRIQRPEDVDAAVVEGASARVRPSLMTVATTVLGLLPLLWEAGVGADVSARTAAPVVGGLWSCMFLTLLVLPAAYSMWRRHQVRAALRVSLPHAATTATSEGAA